MNIHTIINTDDKPSPTHTLGITARLSKAAESNPPGIIFAVALLNSLPDSLPFLAGVYKEKPVV